MLPGVHEREGPGPRLVNGLMQEENSDKNGNLFVVALTNSPITLSVISCAALAWKHEV